MVPAPLQLPWTASTKSIISIPRQSWNSDETPEHLIVLGGGYIGLEFGQMFRRFGSDVTIVHNGAHLMDREDEDIAETMQEILQEAGITLHLRSEATRVAQE